jgi:predicted nucleic acid-binding protein
MVVSEPARPTPNGGVIEWLEEQAALELAISVLTLGEIARGVARMTDGKRKRELQSWLSTNLPAQFEDRVLAIEREVALAWGELTAEGDRTGRPLPVTDGLLLATAKVHGLTIVTRKVSDFDHRGITVLNPYR